MKSQAFNRSNKPAQTNPTEFIILVSGLPRSGTSMMMKILEAGGVPILTDNLRQADEDNPRGYFELERVKKLKDGETAWIETARGKAIKTISALLEYLPSEYQYKVLFMHRDMNEILASQKEMLIRRGESADHVGDEKMAELFNKHLQKIEQWLGEQANFDVFYVNYNEILASPHPTIDQIAGFLEIELDQEAMKRVVDHSLYRQRAKR